MQLSEEYPLSSYLTIGFLPGNHPVAIVQNEKTGKIYLRKDLSVYKRSVYEYLKKYQIPGLPRIIAIYERADQDGKRRLSVIEEYISGQTLQEMLDSGYSFNFREIADIVWELCDIVDRLHTSDPPILHRDIKAANVMMDLNGKIYLLDLNAAKWSDEGGRMSSAKWSDDGSGMSSGRWSGDGAGMDTVLMGTAGYAAPEQYGFGSSGVETDIYALGVLMNVLLTGDIPQRREPKGRLAPIIKKCCQMEKRKRFRDVKSLKMALDPIAWRESPVTDGKFLQAYALPGFRSNNFIYWILALAGYSFIIGMAMEMEYPQEIPAAAQTVYKITTFVCMMGVILFAGNYRGVQEKMPLSRSDHGLVRAVGIVIWCVAIFVAIMVVGIVVMVFFGL
ncbi:MAG: protein kinase [Lachnospiraceae bacterium]|nr:protein kinase [Lachnospiraceae bacterium]